MARGREVAIIKRRRRLFACVCLLALVAVECGRGRQAARASRSTLTVLYPTEELWYVPAQFLLFLPLMARNPTGELEGRLAQSLEHSPDYRTWTIHLRPDVRWHDGVPVTAHDVKFSFDLLSHPDVAMETPGAYDVNVLDETTCTITLRKGAGAYWQDYIACYPRHLLEKLDPKKFYEWDFWRHPVGNGPYRYVRRLPNTMMELEANPEHLRGKPKIERVVLKFGSPALTELLSGDVDAIVWVKEMELLKLAGDSRFRVYDTVEPEHIRAIAWNHRRPLFRDSKVRHALTLAINRRELHQTLNLPARTPVFDVIFTRPQFRRGELPPPLPYDPEAAKRLLEQLGWRDTDGDGVRDRDGKSFQFTALVKAEEGLDKAAVYVQSQLRQVGVRMEITTLEAQAVNDRLRVGQFDAAISIVNEDIEAPFGPIEFFGSNSLLGYRNPRVAALLSRAAESFSPEEHDRIYRELDPIFEADLPVTFLYPLVRTTVAHRRVRGMSSPYREDPVWYTDELWLEDRSQQ